MSTNLIQGELIPKRKIQVILFEVKRVSQDLVTKMCFVFQEIFFLGQRVSQGLVTEMFKV